MGSFDPLPPPEVQSSNDRGTATTQEMDAVKYDNITFKDILDKNFRVMDLTAITICKENNLPIRIFNINNSKDLKKIVLGSNIGTLVKD